MKTKEVDVIACDQAMELLIKELDRNDLNPTEKTFRKNVSGEIFSRLYIKYMDTISLPAEDLEQVKSEITEIVKPIVEEVKEKKPRAKRSTKVN
jgi:hypothetical protein